MRQVRGGVKKRTIAQQRIVDLQKKLGLSPAKVK